jgi:methionine-rich copper-binding protein CopC
MQVLSYTADATVPTVTDWTLNINTGAMVINFSETMDQTVDVDETKITIQQSNNTSTAGEYYTLTDSTSVWTDHNTLTITLSATDLNALKRDTSLAISSATSYLEIAATNLIVDVVGLDLSLTNVTDGACLNVSSFTADTTAPTIVSQTPVDGSTGEAITIIPTVTFSEAMDPTISYQNLIKLYRYSDNSLITSTVTYDTNTLTATIDPVNPLSNNTQYYIWVSGAKDMVGNYLTDYTTKADQEFTTVAISAPTVLSQTPIAGSTGQAITINPTITFSENMATSTINSSNVQLRKYTDDSMVNSSVTYSNKVATIYPTSSLLNNTQYYIWVSGAEDLDTNPVTAYTTKASQEFTTVAISAPTVLSQTPTTGSTDQVITIEPTITFSEDMATSTINLSHVQLRKYDDDSMVNSTFSYNNKVATIKPTSPLLNNTQYYIWVSGAEDLDGNTVTAYTTKASQEFTTVAQADGSLAISPPEGLKPNYATADDSYANGWAWKFTITVPTSETSFKMKFDTWTSSLGNSIESAGNMRYYSAQATTATSSANAIEITDTNEYPATAMTLTGDLDENTAGRQIEVYVEMKVPVGSSGGSYSTRYGILTN